MCNKSKMGVAVTGEDKQQIEPLIMKGSCERVRLEGATGERNVWV